MTHTLLKITNKFHRESARLGIVIQQVQRSFLNWCFALLSKDRIRVSYYTTAAAVDFSLLFFSPTPPLESRRYKSTVRGLERG